MKRDHGGNLGNAMATYGGARADWIDLSTGINRVPYPVPVISDDAWQNLPDRQAVQQLVGIAASTWNVTGDILPLAGAQAAIQLLPNLNAPGRASIIWPTYNEYEGVLRDTEWQVDRVSTIAELAGADLAIVVNPNNPDGQRHNPSELLDLVAKVGLLVVDESFGDVDPALSLADHTDQAGLLVLKSFGKFYGLAGLRLGFACGHQDLIARMAAMAGPWPISGPAIETGIAALQDAAWADATRQRLSGEAMRIDAMAVNAGWSVVGGTDLFRLYACDNATDAQTQLARHHIWSRIFPWSTTWIRLGLPGDETEWQRLEKALTGQG